MNKNKNKFKKELMQLSVPATRLARPPGAINLGPGDPDFKTPQHIIDAAYKALNADKTHYDFSFGQPELRNALSKYFSRFDINADPNTDILVTAGSYESLFRSLFTFLNPGDEVIVTEPRYSGYDPQILFSGAKICPVPFIKERKKHRAFHLDHKEN